jgi:hypothetical protein
MEFEADFPDSAEDIPRLLIPTPSEPCTRPLSLFLNEHWQIFEFLFFTSHLAVAQDQTRLHAVRALAKGGSEEDQKRLELAEKNKDATFKKFQSFGQFYSDTMVVRLVDNFLCYLSELIQLCMKTKPEVLRSSEMVKIEDILKLSNMDEVIEFLVERKINELSYGGTKELNQFCSDRLGMSIWNNEDERGVLSVGVELRNIITHNRGIVNALFLSRLRNTVHPFEFRLGRAFHADFDQLVVLANHMINIARRLDAQAAEKFGINRGLFSRP